MSLGAATSSSTGEAHNYLVFVEELDEEDVAAYRASLSGSALKAGGAGDACMPAPRPSGQWLRGGAWTLFRLLSAMSVSPGLDDAGPRKSVVGSASVPPAAAAASTIAPSASDAAYERYTQEVHKMVFNVMRSELAVGSAALAGSHATAAASLSRQLEVVEVESTVFALLQFMHSLVATQAGRLYIASGDMVKVLLRVFQAGSPRLQRLVLSILASIAGRLDCRVLDACVRSVWPASVVHAWSEVHSNGSPFLGMLLEVAARPALLSTGIRAVLPSHVLLPQVPTGDRPAHLDGFGAGNAAQALASEAVTLLRTLLTLSGFAGSLRPVLEQAVLEAASLVPSSPAAATQSEDDRVLPVGCVDVDSVSAARVLGCLAVMGGFTECVRVGGWADVESAPGVNSRVRIVEFQPGNDGVGVAVVYSPGLAARPVAANVALLRPVAAVQPSSAALTLNAEVFAALKCLVQSQAIAGLTYGSAALAAVLRVAALQVLLTVLQDSRNVSAIVLSGWCGVNGRELLELVYPSAVAPTQQQLFPRLCDLESRWAGLTARLSEASAAHGSLGSPWNAASGAVPMFPATLFSRVADAIPADSKGTTAAQFVGVLYLHV